MRDETEIRKVLHGVRCRFLQRSAQEMQSIHLGLDKLDSADSTAMVELGNALHRIAGTAGILELGDVAEHAGALEQLIKAISPEQPRFDLPRLRQAAQGLDHAVRNALATLDPP